MDQRYITGEIFGTNSAGISKFRCDPGCTGLFFGYVPEWHFVQKFDWDWSWSTFKNISCWGISSCKCVAMGTKNGCAPPQTSLLWTAYYFYIRRAPHTLICLPYFLEEFCLEFCKPKAFFFKLMNGKSCERKMHLLNDEGVIEITCQFRVWR